MSLARDHLQARLETLRSSSPKVVSEIIKIKQELRLRANFARTFARRRRQLHLMNLVRHKLGYSETESRLPTEAHTPHHTRAPQTRRGHLAILRGDSPSQSSTRQRQQVTKAARCISTRIYVVLDDPFDQGPVVDERLVPNGVNCCIPIEPGAGATEEVYEECRCSCG
jgi:hypothetical protein